MRHRIWLVIAAAAACAPRSVPAQEPTPTDSIQSGLVPAGHGQLPQDAITLLLRSGSLDIRFTPLDERVTRLLAPDSWQSLQDLVARHRARIDSVTTRFGVRNPGLVMVTFFALASDTRFDPRLLSISSRNQLLRPIGVIPLSPSFSAQQLGVRDQAMGLYIFDQPVPVTEPFSVEYLDAATSDWERRLARFDRERARITSRAGASGGPAGESR